jgi:hypothetical protein
MDVSTPAAGDADRPVAAHREEPGLLAALARHTPAAFQAQATAAMSGIVSVHAGKLIACALAGGWLALVLAAALGGLAPPVAGSIAALCLVLVLLVIAAWDLVVRWGLITRGQPLTVAPQTRRWQRWLARYFYPWLVLLAGIVFGHFAWR